MVLALVYIWRGSLFNAAEAIKLSKGLPKQPMTLAFVCALTLSFTMLGGIFLSGQSHVVEFRWLRPVGAWLMAGGTIMICSLVSALLVQTGKGHFDDVLSKIVFFALILLAAELVINFISEFYRPRAKVEMRPEYESHLLAFFTEPGGVMRNLADSLDYQFGFKVSKTWIYGFISRALLPALLVWAILFWISTIIAEVRPGELALRSVLGAVSNKQAPLTPGVYFKLPYPLEKIITVNVETVNEVFVGAKFEKDGHEVKPGLLLWTSEHGKDSDKGYLVANDAVAGTVKGGEQNEMAKAVSILEVTLPVHYKVKKEKLYEYVFNFESIRALLIDISTQEATRYFASTDFMKDLSSARTDIMEELRKRIQKSLDQLDAGILITNVNMNDAHPPVKEVVPAFQDVLAAKEEAKKTIYIAEGEAAKTVAEGEIESLKIVSTAQADSFGVRTEAEADAFRFQRQLTAYKQQPDLFKLRTYLDFLENDCKELRKLIISSSIPSQIYELNLEETARLDLLNSGEVSKFGK